MAMDIALVMQSLLLEMESMNDTNYGHAIQPNGFGQRLSPPNHAVCQLQKFEDNKNLEHTLR